MMKDCNGINCKQYERLHSRECLAQYAAAIAGGLFVKAGTPKAPSVGDVQRYSESDGEGGGVYPDKDGELCDYKHITARDQQITELQARIQQLELDAARYQWLRKDHAYAPEEFGVRGGVELDELCGKGISGDLYGE